jgi:hypothetical protein
LREKGDDGGSREEKEGSEQGRRWEMKERKKEGIEQGRREMMEERKKERKECPCPILYYRQRADKKWGKHEKDTKKKEKPKLMEGEDSTYLILFHWLSAIHVFLICRDVTCFVGTQCMLTSSTRAR